MTLLRVEQTCCSLKWGVPLNGWQLALKTRATQQSLGGRFDSVTPFFTNTTENLYTMKNEVSKKMTYILRHNPDAYGVRMNQYGWVDIEDLERALDVFRGDIRFIVDTDKKGRFELSEPLSVGQPTLIRATNGHSFPVDLSLPQVVPPITLYHGTAYEFCGEIMRNGIIPMSRQFVHLTDEHLAASIVGRRKSKNVVVLKVRALDMHVAGHVFYKTINGYFYVKEVPPEFIGKES